MSNYKDKIVVVAGGTGGVGEGIVKYFADQGAIVVVPTRNVANSSRLSEYLGDKASNLHIIEGNVADESSAEKVRNAIIEKFGHIDAMVASLGGWWQGVQLVDLSEAEWTRLIQANLTSHFVTAKTFIPAISDGGSYTFIAGFSAYQAYPGAGPIAVAGAGQLMLRKVFSAENTRQSVRINDLILGPINTRNRPAQYQDPMFLSSEEIGKFSGFIAFDEGKTVTNQTIHLESKGDVEIQESKINQNLNN